MAKFKWGILWANLGTATAPDTSKQNNGWQAGEKPPNTAFNWFWQNVVNNFRVLNDQGVFEWDSATTYGADSVCIHSGVLYVSNSAGNINNTPSASSIYWQAIRRPNVVVGATQPSNGQVGNIWIDSDTQRAYYCSVAHPTNTWLPMFDESGVQRATAGGSANAITANFTVPHSALADVKMVIVRAIAANTSTAPTINIDSLGAITIVKDSNSALRPGDIAGASHDLLIAVNVSLNKAILLNPASSVAASTTVAGVQENSTLSELIAGSANDKTVTPDILLSLRKAVMIVQDRKSANVDGGSFTAGSWVTRDLNYVLRNNITGASLSSNRITLPAGTYKIKAKAGAAGVNMHKIKIVSISGEAFSDILGTNENSTQASNDVTTWSTVSDILELNTETVIELQHRCINTQNTTGRGVAINIGVDEIYAEVEISLL